MIITNFRYIGIIWNYANYECGKTYQGIIISHLQYHCMQCIKYLHSVIVSLIDNYIRRMPKCNTVLQIENDIFGPLIKPNSPGNCQFSALILTLKSSKCFGHCPVKILVLHV